MQRIELDDQTVNDLAAQAGARGLTISEYLKTLVPPTANGRPCASFDELDAELEELVLELPTLPRDFSRADIYDDERD